MNTIWLVVWMIFSDGTEHTVVDKSQPDIATCWVEAAKAHDKYVDQLKNVDDEWELNVSCAAHHRPPKPEEPA
jgi:hypothetical protein